MSEVDETSRADPLPRCDASNLDKPLADACDLCGAPALVERKCKVICRNCGAILRTCADLG